jgi:hypothetical protein
MQKSLFGATALFTILLFIFVSCGTEDNFFPPPDLSTVPEPYSIDNLEPFIPEEGVEVYVHEEGTGPFYVTNRDELLVFLTLRTDEGEIIYSTFANGSESPLTVQMRNAGQFQNVFQYSILRAYTPGLKTGLMGMREGEKRTLVVSPEKGFGTVSAGNSNAVYRENTLIYDVRVSSIHPK